MKMYKLTEKWIEYCDSFFFFFQVDRYNFENSKAGYWLVISVYLSSLPVVHLSDAQRRRFVITWDSVRIQDETTESSAWFFNVIGIEHRHTGCNLM